MATPLVIKSRQTRLPIVSQQGSGLSATNQPRVLNVSAVKNPYTRLPSGRPLR